MKIFGKTLTEYIRFEWGFLLLVVVVGFARLALSLAGVPVSTVRFLSMTVVLLLGVIYYSVRVHTSGFGSYKQLLPVLALPVIADNLIVIGSIITAILTGKDNIFSAPEFSPGKVDGKNWGHVAGHTVTMIVVPLVFWAIGCLIMLVTKKVIGSRQQTA